MIFDDNLLIYDKKIDDWKEFHIILKEINLLLVVGFLLVATFLAHFQKIIFSEREL